MSSIELYQCHYCERLTFRLCQRCKNVVYCSEDCELADMSKHASVCKMANDGSGFIHKEARIAFEKEKPLEWERVVSLLNFIVYTKIPMVLVVLNNDIVSKKILNPHTLKSFLAEDNFKALINMFNTRKEDQVCLVFVDKNERILLERMRLGCVEI